MGILYFGILENYILEIWGFGNIYFGILEFWKIIFWELGNLEKYILGIWASKQDSARGSA